MIFVGIAIDYEGIQVFQGIFHAVKYLAAVFLIQICVSSGSTFEDGFHP